MRPLHESLLVSGDMPLTQFVSSRWPSLYYRLVLMDDRIAGIVTRADLLKLPVRTLAFTLIAHLEVVLAEYIRAHYRGSTWMEQLGESTQKRVRGRYQSLKRHRAELDLLECTNLCDKRDLVAKCLNSGRREFECAMKGIQKLRNSLMHAGIFIENNTDIRTFVARLEDAECYIERLTTGLTMAPDSDG
jgi:hypothetical protein